MSEVTDAMVDAYLSEQRRTVEVADQFGRPNIGGLHTNTVREATRNGISAALAAAPAQPPSKDERALRRLLCARYEHLPYMDDGEAQGQTLDWLRCSVEQIEARIREINLQKIAAPAQPYDQAALELCDKCGWKALIPGDECLNCNRDRYTSASFAAPAQPDNNLQMASPIFALAVQALNGVKAWRDCEGNDGFPDEVREQIDAVLSAFELRYTAQPATHPTTGEPMGTAEQEATAWKLAKENLERENAALRTKCAMLSGALKGALALAGTAPAPMPSPTPQADSQPAPANTRQIAECYGDCPEDPKTCANPCKFEGRAARAQADSVLEDAK